MKIKRFYAGLIAIFMFFCMSADYSYAESGIQKLQGDLQSGELGGDAKVGAAGAEAPSQSLEVLLNCAGPNNYTGKGTNICGQYAMSTVLNYYGIDETYETTMNATNPSGMSFTAPDPVYQYLAKKGIAVSYKNNASLKNITDNLDSGNPAVLLVDAGGSPHWITIIGYKKNAGGTLKSFIMRDSYWGINSNNEMAASELQKKWSQPLAPTNKILGAAFDYHNLIIAPAGKSDARSIKDKLGMPGNFSMATDDQILSGANLAVTGWYQKNYGKMALGALEVVSALPQKLMSELPGGALEKAGTAVSGWGKKQAEKGGVFNKVVGTAASGLGAVVNTVGKGVSTVGNAISSAAEAGFNGLKNLFKF